MFHNIPPPTQNRMRQLEQADAQDRVDGTARMQRLRQVLPETGKFLAILAASAPPGNLIEIGTSAGYSTLWLALACRAARRTITTFELLPEKIRLATETFTLAGVTDIVTLVAGDAREHLSHLTDIAFCFLDAEKEVYADCYEAVVPNLVSGGLLIADNALSHQADLQPIIDRARQDPRVDVVLVPIGKGELVCRKV
ncbi:MAG: O-methyltransferase [Chloroflexi bacterium]|nr:O-methyltransferase [Chloroflexota bacterium]